MVTKYSLMIIERIRPYPTLIIQNWSEKINSWFAVGWCNIMNWKSPFIDGCKLTETCEIDRIALLSVMWFIARWNLFHINYFSLHDKFVCNFFLCVCEWMCWLVGQSIPHTHMQFFSDLDILFLLHWLPGDLGHNLVKLCGCLYIKKWIEKD
jgi:hypothetical protein